MPKTSKEESNPIKTPNRFELSLAAAKRARQLKEGASPLIELNDTLTSYLPIALEEIRQGKISVLEDVKPENEDPLLENFSKQVKRSKPEEEDKKEAKKKDKKKSKSLAA